MPPESQNLPVLFNTMVDESVCLPDIYDQAIFVFLSMARWQFFYDVNKRMGRLMMNGLLLSAGFPAINLPAKRQLEFNNLMLTFYASGEQQPMNTFLRTCLDERVIQIMQEDNSEQRRSDHISC
jgi:prophage maintenance system killer protein